MRPLPTPISLSPTSTIDISNFGARFCIPARHFSFPNPSVARSEQPNHGAIDQYRPSGLSCFAGPSELIAKMPPPPTPRARPMPFYASWPHLSGEQLSKGNISAIVYNSKKLDQAKTLGVFVLSPRLPKDRISGEWPAMGFAIGLNIPPNEFIVAVSDIQNGSVAGPASGQRVGLKSVEERTTVKADWRQPRIRVATKPRYAFQISTQTAARKAVDGFRFTGPIYPARQSAHVPHFAASHRNPSCLLFLSATASAPRSAASAVASPR